MSVPVLVQTLIDEQEKELSRRQDMQVGCFETMMNPKVSASRQDTYSRMFWKHEELIQKAMTEIYETKVAASGRCPF